MKHMPLFENIRKCVSRRHGLSRRVTKVLFNVKISESFKSPNVPSQIRDLLVYIAREGVAVTDLFRRPGNPQDMKKIIADLEAGRPIKWTDYNFYTLANIAKRYLLHIEGGVLGPQSEEKLLSTLDIQDDQARIEAMHSVIVSQPKPVQQLLALLFGIWFRMIYHTEVNAMSVEAVAKSVAGSVFPSCTTTPRKVERASKVMEYLITGFASADLFSRELIEYFTLETKTSISRVEKFKYEFRFPKDVPREKSVRLFVRMLLEEGRKHGFHLINDAVSKEVFEQATWYNASAPVVSNCDEKSRTDQVTSQSEDRLSAENTSPNVSRVQNISSSQSERYITKDGTVLYAESSSTLTPTLPRRENKLYQHDSNGFDLLTAPIQQTSEKRTCVTTTPIAESKHAPIGNLNARRTYDFANPIAKTENFDHHLPRYSHLSNTVDRCGGYDSQIKASALQTPTSQTVCFNSVKRRQLERLQKRSDWFLSPPAGLRSSTGLIHLNPKAPDVGHTHLSPHAENETEKSPSNYDNNDNNNNPIVPVEQNSTSDIDSTSLMDIELSEDVVVTDYNSNLGHYNVNDDVGHLVFTAPERLWDCGNVKTTTVSTGCKRNSRTLLPEQTTAPTATSSPNWQTDSLKNYPAKRSSLRPVIDEKENYPEVETRYYVVERYYGPEPRPPPIGVGGAGAGQRVMNHDRVPHACRL
ncbi:unnamed protein product [Trichobilharzia szidati]|nr:unnamed protein product [Trichobilharzia szidati]